jgi:hypothetical protein
MINNEFIYQPNIKLDIDYISKLVANKQFQHQKGIAGHQRMVKDDPYMSSIQAKFPFLSTMYNIYTVYGKKNIPMHVDAARDCAFNIPIKGTEESDTIFYKFKDEPLLEYNKERVYNLVKSEVEEVYRFTLLRPTLIDNAIPHEVINRGIATRVIVSWSVKKDYSFTDAKALFEKITNESVHTEG